MSITRNVGVVKMSFNRLTESKTNYCKCAYDGVDKTLFRKTNGKLSRYKCKKCDSFWLNKTPRSE